MVECIGRLVKVECKTNVQRCFVRGTGLSLPPMASNPIRADVFGPFTPVSGHVRGTARRQQIQVRVHLPTHGRALLYCGRVPVSFRTHGFETVDPSNGNVYHANTLTLAEHVASLMEAAPSGGIACEPGAVFFSCQTHHHIALLMLESLGIAGIAPGRFAHLRRKFEAHALSTMRAPIRTGALKIVVVERPLKVGVPFGHMGMDGWSLAWYYPWAWHDAIPKQIWHRISAPAMPSAEIETAPRTLRSPPPSASCCALNIPASGWIASLWPALVQIGDADTAARLKAWLCTHLLSFTAASSSPREPAAYLQEHVEWAIGNSANFLLGCSLEASGADALRQLVHHPPSRSFFTGPLITEVLPASCSVYQAFMREDDAEMLVEIGLDRDASDVSLLLVNTSTVGYVRDGSENPLSGLRFSVKAQGVGMQIKKLTISWKRSPQAPQAGTSAERRIVLMLGVS